MADAVLINSLRQIVGAAAVLTEPHDVAPYATDWRRMFRGQPACVVRPGSTAEVAAVVGACRQHRVAIVPQGGNTGLAGGATPDASGTEVVLSLARMTAIRGLDTVGLTVEVEAGAILQTVKEAVAKEGRLLPISLAAEGSATIGGLVSTNAGGVNVLRYGMTRALTLGLEVVLADGTIVNGLRRLRKDNAGYDWKQLIIGSEGTLAIVTAAVLRLVPQSRYSVTALLSVPDVAVAIAMFDLAMTEVGETLSAFELISGSGMALVSKHAGLEPPIAAGAWFVLIEAASSLQGLNEAVQRLLEIAFEKGWALDGVVAESGAQAARLWALRENLTEAEGREGPSVKHDVSMPLTAMPTFLAEVDIALAQAAPGARLNVFGHLGDGNLHVNVLTGPDHEALKINQAIHDIVTLHGGSISAEHGLGQYRVAEWQRLRPSSEQELVTRLKGALDPDGRLNPGKVVPVSASVAHAAVQTRD